MDDQVTLVNLDDFQLHYEHIADFDNGASPTGDVIINLIDAANHAIQAGMNACDLILASEQCAKPEAYLQGARFSFNVSSSPLGLVIGYDGVNIDE
jgi:hypothetical protein